MKPRVFPREHLPQYLRSDADRERVVGAWETLAAMMRATNVPCCGTKR